MGPRRRRRGRKRSDLPMDPPEARLQWGHVVVDVEGHRSQARRTCRPRRFNGATSSSTWKENVMLWGPPGTGSFNGATSSSTWKARSAARRAPTSRRLQWGHVVVDVEGQRHPDKRRDRLPASTGPRRRRRGRPSSPGSGTGSATGFNGATSSSTWKVAAGGPNVAHYQQASMGPRRRRRGRLDDAAVAGVASIPLQWGHVVVDVEGAPFRFARGRPDTASMGPRRRRRGRGGHLRRNRPARHRFNGATSSSTWKDTHRHRVAPSRRIASMGPRRRRPGRGISTNLRQANTGSLQWGHVVVDVEGLLVPVGGAAQAPLQWGHVVVDVEGMTIADRILTNLLRLQWGHVVVNVEGRPAPALHASPPPCFNGATSSSTWKAVKVSGERRYQGLASMGPRRRRRGRSHSSRPTPVSTFLLQWGHVVVDVEGTTVRPPRKAGLCVLQWGHVVVDVEG